VYLPDFRLHISQGPYEEMIKKQGNALKTGLNQA
jgi:hypothetical protein